MSNNTSQRPINPCGPAIYKAVNGVRYFKLKSGFEGDYTKNCGLLAEEIDENFYFLRGYDIESIELDDERNLVITRVNKDYDPIKVSLDEELLKTQFEVDKERCAIKVTYPDGEVIYLDGVLVEGMNVRIATDSTLEGDGTIHNPLRIACTDATGTFAPAMDYMDIIGNGNVIPPAVHPKGYRIVTKETIDNFGKLYTQSAVDKINQKLKETGSEWRVPTKEDWDELLNAMECESDRNHGSVSCKWLGKVAGSALKATNLWLDYPVEITELPVVGRDVVGFAAYPLGVTPDRNDILMAQDNDVEGYSKIGGMWTSTKTPEGNSFVKLFAYNHADVDQDTYGRGARFSLRLVKDFNFDNYNEIEYILGLPYPTVLIQGIHDDFPYAKIWTQINVYSGEYDGIVSDEWDLVPDGDRGIKTVYYINEWTGTEWHKKLLENGDSVVIANYKYTNGDYLPEDFNNDFLNGSGLVYYHEWRLIDGELVDTLESLKSEIQDDLDLIRIDIVELSGATSELSAGAHTHINILYKQIEDEVNRAVSAETFLNDKIEAETSRAASAETFLNDKIEAETSRAASAETFLNDKIEEEIARASLAENALSDRIEAELNRAVSAETFLNDKIEAEINRAVSAETVLNDKIENEISRAASAETFLNDKIEAEINRAVSAETFLNDKIEAEISRASSAETFLNDKIEQEIQDRLANDYVPGDYVISGESNTKVVIPTYGDDVQDITIRVSDDFFNFGTF